MEAATVALEYADEDNLMQDDGTTTEIDNSAIKCTAFYLGRLEVAFAAHEDAVEDLSMSTHACIDQRITLINPRTVHHRPVKAHVLRLIFAWP